MRVFRLSVLTIYFGITEESDESWGHNNYYPTGVAWAGRFNTVDTVHAEKGWTKLAGGVTLIARSKPHMEKENMPVGDVYGCFENRYGCGRGIYYSPF